MVLDSILISTTAVLILKSDGTIFHRESAAARSPPTLSPDLAPSDFWLCGHIKTGLAGGSFAQPEEL
jgi:hypothetical protein